MRKKSMWIGFKLQLDVGIGWEDELFRDWVMSSVGWLVNSSDSASFAC